MKAAEVWDAGDLADRLHRPAVRRIFGQRPVRADPIVVIAVSGEDAVQVRFTEDDQMVETLAAD